MNFFEKITGNDLKKEMEGFEERASNLPSDYQAAWNEIVVQLWPHGDFSGRNLMPVFDHVLELLEVTSADGLPVEEVFDGDPKAFAEALMGDDRAKTYRDKWRDQLNRNVARKLEGLK